ncbi:MAG: PqqD family protein [Bacteroidia bacterium]|jgi:hypothetical protein
MKKNIALSDTGFLFNPSTGDSYSTNPIGLDIIRELKEGSSPKEVLKFIMEKYEVEESRIEKDLGDFIDMLKSFQLMDNNG